MKLSTLDQALRQTPRDPVLWLRLGDGLLQRGAVEHAQEAYARATMLRPQCLLARLKWQRLAHPPAPAPFVDEPSSHADSLWGQGWLEPEWDETSETDAGESAKIADAFSTPVAQHALVTPGRAIRIESATRESLLDGMELLGITATAATLLLLGARAWTLYHSMIGATLLLLSVRHLQASAWLRRTAPLGVAGALGLCVVLVVAAPLALFLWPLLEGVTVREPLGFQLVLCSLWLLTTLAAAYRLSR